MVVIAAALTPAAQAGDDAATVAPAHLRCESLADPQGIDARPPRLSWRLVAADPDHRGARQTAYRILVASSRQALERDEGDLWDSGVVRSDQQLHIAYAGRPLRSRAVCWWKVRVWDESDQPSRWSSPARWSMGLLSRDDWKAKWITDPASAANARPRRVLRSHHVYAVDPESGEPFPPQPAPMLRKQVTIDGPIERATAYVTARGMYELRINGRRVGDQQLAPGWTDYNLRMLYQTYDVRELMQPGENAIGAILGVGWYAGELGPLTVLGRRLYGPAPQLLLQIEIDKADGTRQTIVSDGTWTATREGPIRISEIYHGEDYDARNEMPGWDAAGFDDRGWRPAAVEPLDDTALEAQTLEPIRKTRAIAPISVREVDRGVYQFDMGQNLVGWCRLKLRGEAGQQVTLVFAEALTPQGRLDRPSVMRARATDTYICRGDGEGETFEPRFTYHGFRFVEVSGLTEAPAIDDLTAYVVRSDAPLTASIETSSPIVNGIAHAALWTQIGNMHSVPTDCPQRNERLGWMGDIQAFSQSACYQMDMSAFFAKWLGDIRGAQFESGAFTNIAPYHFLGCDNGVVRGEGQGGYYGTFAGAPAWADAGVFIPWRHWVNYADRRVVAQHYESARRWVDYMHRHNPQTLLFLEGRGQAYGDWLPAGPKLDNDILASAFFAESTRLVARMAAVLKRDADAQRYARLHARVRAAFQRAYLAEDGRMPGDNPAGYALALRFDLYPPALRDAATRHMIEGVARRPHGTLPTGIQTTHRLMRELTRNGRHDEACRLMNLRVAPSWGHMLEQGATTIWENWRGTTSLNHFALGSVIEWVWRDVAGVNPDPQQPGYRHMIIAPRPSPEHALTWCRARYESIRGPIHVDWKVEAGRFELALTVPPNTTATVRVPTSASEAVREGGAPAAEAAGVTALPGESGAALFRVESGRYVFTAPWE